MKKFKLWLEFVKMSKSYTGYSWIRIILSFGTAHRYMKGLRDWENAGSTNEERYMNTNRNFIGIELDKKYFDIGVDRTEKAKENYQPELF